ncbi:hypothetical protein Brms1b_003717 [Colletotrichum noveboracense]|nr:hypothetical protein COL940_002555 [Colletotrichum noveboracense]KAJ0293516.1 hypothetical protein CBS470a_001721 [Colletotrichum nupharicola]KAJ0319562.1 hypothetical protein Brms1b_003717 [Colletotrichum noveboracense]
MFTLLGRGFDLYVGIIWWSYGAVLSCGIFGALQRNIRTGTLWALLGFAGLLDIILEECMLIYGGIYTYYGHQPLVFNVFPCWWAFCNVSSIFVGISITYRQLEFVVLAAIYLLLDGMIEEDRKRRKRDESSHVRN